MTLPRPSNLENSLLNESGDGVVLSFSVSSVVITIYYSGTVASKTIHFSFEAFKVWRISFLFGLWCNYVVAMFMKFNCNFLRQCLTFLVVSPWLCAYF